jgi:hypothetical protein
MLFCGKALSPNGIDLRRRERSQRPKNDAEVTGLEEGAGMSNTRIAAGRDPLRLLKQHLAQEGSPRSRSTRPR